MYTTSAACILAFDEMLDILKTYRMLLREWRDEDRIPFARLNADSQVMEFFPGTLTEHESDLLMSRIRQQNQDRGFGLYAVELCQTGSFIGFIGLAVPSFDAHFTPCVEIGWRLAADTWGHGLATEGAAAVVSYGFDQLGLSELVSFTALLNTRSRRVMEKLGMTHDPEEDFNHPNLPVGHTLARHVLCRLRCDDSRFIRTSPL